MALCNPPPLNLAEFDAVYKYHLVASSKLSDQWNLLKDNIASTGPHRQGLTDKGSQAGPHRQGPTGRVSQTGDHGQGLTDRGPRTGPHRQGPTDRASQTGAHGQGLTSRVSQTGAYGQGLTDRGPRAHCQVYYTQKTPYSNMLLVILLISTHYRTFIIIIKFQYYFTLCQILSVLCGWYHVPKCL